MDGIDNICDMALQHNERLNKMLEEYKRNLHAILYNKKPEKQAEPLQDTTNITPHQESKRPKRLTALDENEENIPALLTSKSNESLSKKPSLPVVKSASELMPPPLAPSVPVSNTNSDVSFSRPQRAAKLNCEKHLKEPDVRSKLRQPSKEDCNVVKIKLESEQRASQSHQSFATVKRVDSTTSIASQDSVVVLPAKTPSIVSINSDDDHIAPDSITKIKTGETLTKSTIKDETVEGVRSLRVRIKREKVSISFEEQQNATETETTTHPKGAGVVNIESSMASSMLSVTTGNSVNTTKNKKPQRKKKTVPKPIKVERFSDGGEEIPATPIAARTRNSNKSFEQNKGNSIQKNKLYPEQPVEQDQRNGSVYQEAQETLSTSKNESSTAKSNENKPEVINEVSTTTNSAKQMLTPTNPIDSTMILGSAPNDATYCTASAATFVVDAQNPTSGQALATAGDLTFDVAVEKTTESQRSSKQSMETARDTLQPHPDSLITEDESDECSKMPATNVKQMSVPGVATKTNVGKFPSTNTLPMSAKAYKMPTRTIEIFNPLVQSPVKAKVEAYENAAAAQAVSTGAIKRTQSKQAKQNILVTSSSTTPVIGKITGTAFGRFLTPTNSSHITPNAMAQGKKIPASASKAMTLKKSSSASSLKTTASSAKALSRENSAEDIRKGIYQMAEERKKQREQKHILAAQQREAKERERAERMAKVAKEREEKRLKKLQESEQRKRELEEIQKKIREQEGVAGAEIAKMKAKVQMEQALLEQIASQPSSSKSNTRTAMPHPKIQSKYTFDMLHEDDSTDDENKTSYKRPPPPTWSRSHVRGPSIRQQQVMPTDIVDSFFSVEPMTPDLQSIFPAIDPRHLKRNSSAFWSTPPRYSELPKY